jgi:hypothetical protein
MIEEADMHVALIGGGPSGNAIKRALTERGATTELLSRSTGFDVLHDDAKARLREAEVIVEATGRFTTSPKIATDFFTRSTRAIAAAANASGARHILLSIVNCDVPQVQGYGYFAGKTAQERTARAESRRLTIVRSTQWFEFARQNLDRMRLGPIALVAGMTMKPVALDAFAGVIADSALGIRSGTTIEVSGPEVTTLWKMTMALTDRHVIPVPLPIPGRMGRAFRAGALLPGGDAEVVGPSFAAWQAGGA